MEFRLIEGTAEEALKVLGDILAVEDPFNPDFEKITFGAWPSIRIHLPKPAVDSSITPPFMEAFLELQKQIYQLAAQAETGSSDTGFLSEGDKLRLQISVIVTGGSSNFLAELKGTIGFSP